MTSPSSVNSPDFPPSLHHYRRSARRRLIGRGLTSPFFYGIGGKLRILISAGKPVSPLSTRAPKKLPLSKQKARNSFYFCLSPSSSLPSSNASWRQRQRWPARRRPS